jgi:hypothetical protein
MTTKYKVIIPFIPSMGSVDPIIVTPTPMESVTEQALWHLNKMREHDGLPRLTHMPLGTKYERL